jgi:hypothetical protein
MTNILRKTGTALTYLGGGLTLITFAQGITTNNQNKTIMNSLKTRISKQDEVIKKYEEIIKQNNNNVEIKSKLAEIEENTKTTLMEQDNINNITAKIKEATTGDLSMIKTDLNHHVQNQTENLISGSGKFDELKEIIEKIVKSNSGSNNNFISLSEWQEILLKLPNEKVGALGHILLSLAMIMSLISILSIFYGEYLIKKYDLENKYPKIASFINLRRKFQNYYLMLSILFMITSLLLIIYVNILVFIN